MSDFCEKCGIELSGTIDMAAGIHVDLITCRDRLFKQLSDCRKELGILQETETDLNNTIGFMQTGLDDWKAKCEGLEKELAEAKIPKFTRTASDESDHVILELMVSKAKIAKELAEARKGIVIGKYTIRRYDDKSIWIECDDGEGMQLMDETAEKYIKNIFYECM